MKRLIFTSLDSLKKSHNLQVRQCINFILVADIIVWQSILLKYFSLNNLMKLKLD